MYKLSEKEIKTMSFKPAKERYVYFIKRVADWESVWFLKDKNGLVISSDNKGNKFIPIWPFKEYALNCRIDEWENSNLEEIPLENLLDTLLPQLVDDDMNLSVFMVSNDDNVAAVSASDLLNDLLSECSKYE